MKNEIINPKTREVLDTIEKVLDIPIDYRQNGETFDIFWVSFDGEEHFLFSGDDIESNVYLYGLYSAACKVANKKLEFSFVKLSYE